MVNHFGRNPRNGGIPPILSIITSRLSFSIVVKDLMLNWLIYIILYFLKVIDNIMIINEYIIIYMIHNFLYIMAHDINQPI